MSMTFKSMWRPDSKQFWLGILAIATGATEMFGVNIPLLADLASTFFPDQSGGPLITAGLYMIFQRDAIAKNGAGA